MPGTVDGAISRRELIGIEQSQAAVAEASAFADAVLPELNVAFQAGDACATGCEDDIADAVVSLDVVQLVEDRNAFFREAARLLRSGGLVILTTWESTGESPGRFPADLAAELRSAGFVDVEVLDRPRWSERQRGIYERAVKLYDEYPDDQGLARLALEARASIEGQGPRRRRVLAAARAV